MTDDEIPTDELAIARARREGRLAEAEAMERLRYDDLKATLPLVEAQLEQAERELDEIRERSKQPHPPVEVLLAGKPAEERVLRLRKRAEEIVLELDRMERARKAAKVNDA